jgi:hypothetical protein
MEFWTKYLKTTGSFLKQVKTLFLLVLPLYLVLQACNGDQPDLSNDLPFDATSLGASLTFIPMYKAKAGYLVSPSSKEYLNTSLEMKNGVPIMLQAFSYSLTSKVQVNQSLILQDLNRSLLVYPFCQFGSIILHTYNAKSELEENPDDFVYIVSGYCKDVVVKK